MGTASTRARLLLLAASAECVARGGLGMEREKLPHRSLPPRGSHCHRRGLLCGAAAALLPPLGAAHANEEERSLTWGPTQGLTPSEIDALDVATRTAQGVVLSNGGEHRDLNFLFSRQHIFIHPLSCAQFK